MKNKKIVITGTGHGDEGKAKITHDFSSKYDWVIRTAGANNCGHTIYRDGKKYVHNLIPSFDWRNKKTKAFIGSNVLIDINHLLLEVESLWSENPGVVQNIYVDPDAFTILPDHIKQDKEKNKHIGSTNRGVGPAMVEKMGRSGLKVSHFIGNNDERILNLKKMGVNFKYNLELENNFTNSSIIFEGAQGIMIDIDHGSYPYVSCGSAGLAGIHSSGFSYIKIDNIYGIAKAYLTKVGNGPIPTIADNKMTKNIAKVGKEVGATTGRPRSIAYLDLPSLKYAITKGGITDLVMTKFDVLNGVDKIPVCTSYKGIDKVVSASQLFDAVPEYTHMNGWGSCSADANYIDAMALYEFVKKIEDSVGVKVSHVSTGISERDIRTWR